MLTAPQVRPAATVAATNLVMSLPMVFSTLLFGGSSRPFGSLFLQCEGHVSVHTTD